MSAFNITMLEGYTKHALFEHMRTCVQNEALHDFTIIFSSYGTSRKTSMIRRFSKFSLCLLGNYFSRVTTDMRYVEARNKELELNMEGFEASSMLLLFELVFNGNCMVRNVQQCAMLSMLANRFEFPQKVVDTVNQSLEKEVHRLTFVEVEQPLGRVIEVNLQSCMELLPSMPDVYKPMVLYYFHNALLGPAFVSLPVETLCDILADDNLAVDDEQTVAEAVKLWLKYNAYVPLLPEKLPLRVRARHGMDVDWDKGFNVLEYRGIRAMCASSMGMIYAVHEGLKTRSMMQDTLEIPWPSSSAGPKQMLLLHEYLIIVSKPEGQLSITNIFHETWQPVVLSTSTAAVLVRAADHVQPHAGAGLDKMSHYREAKCTCVTAAPPYAASGVGEAAYSFVAGYSDGHIGLWFLSIQSDKHSPLMPDVHRGGGQRGEGEQEEWFCTKVKLPTDRVARKMVTWQQFVIWLDKKLAYSFATDVHTGNHIRVNEENVKVCGMVVCHKGLVYTTFEGELVLYELGGGWSHLLTVNNLMKPGLSCLVVCGSQIVCGGKSNDLWVIDIDTFKRHSRQWTGIPIGPLCGIKSLCYWPGVGVCSLSEFGQVALWSRRMPPESAFGRAFGAG